MSRPCFALSVMLCCLAGPLLIVGKTHAQDTVASPDHDPGECIVCPLAYGPNQVCGGYSDYDYNKYWYDDYSPRKPEAVPQADPELEVAQSLTNDSTEQAWESDYEDYYADYEFGDDSAESAGEAEPDADVTLEETPAPIALFDAASETLATSETSRGEEDSEQDDEDGWYTDDTAGDYFDSYDSYEPIAPEKRNSAVVPQAVPAIDYEGYEEEWFSYESEATIESHEVDLATDEAYSDENAGAEAAEIQTSSEIWGDEEAWYREEYGYEDTLDEDAEEASTDFEPAETLGTGYDEAYDEAMATDWDAVEPLADSLPADPDAQGEFDEFESGYDAYDDLYDIGSTPDQPYQSQSSETEPEANEFSVDSEPAWLTKLVRRMLTPVWTAAVDISNAPMLKFDSPADSYSDVCSQEWDCESDDWARPQAEQPSVVLQAADTLDGMASVLQNAAELLRGVANGSLAETARTGKANSTR